MPAAACHRAPSARHKKKLCPQGEVSAADLSFVFGNTSANSNTVQPHDETADQAAIIAKLNELVQALRR